MKLLYITLTICIASTWLICLYKLQFIDRVHHSCVKVKNEKWLGWLSYLFVIVITARLSSQSRIIRNEICFVANIQSIFLGAYSTTRIIYMKYAKTKLICHMGNGLSTYHVWRFSFNRWLRWITEVLTNPRIYIHGLSVFVSFWIQHMIFGTDKVKSVGFVM